jgi:hypothetical protein
MKSWTWWSWTRTVCGANEHVDATTSLCIPCGIDEFNLWDNSDTTCKSLSEIHSTLDDILPYVAHVKWLIS